MMRVRFLGSMVCYICSLFFLCPSHYPPILAEVFLVFGSLLVSLSQNYAVPFILTMCPAPSRPVIYHLPWHIYTCNYYLTVGRSALKMHGFGLANDFYNKLSYSYRKSTMFSTVSQKPSNRSRHSPYSLY